MKAVKHLRRYVEVLAATAAVSLSASRAMAQQFVFEVDHPGTWQLQTSLPSRGRPTPAEARAMMVRLDSLVALVRRGPAFSPQRGFNIVGSVTVLEGNATAARWQPVRGMVRIIPLAWYRECPTCAVLVEGEGHGIEFGVNTSGPISSYREVHGGCGGRAVFRRPAEVARVSGAPVFENGTLVITARDVPLFLPVSRAQWVQANIDESGNQFGCSHPDPRVVAQMDALRAGWTPEQLAMEAWEPPREYRGPDPLGQPGAPGATQWVRMNPEIYDTTRVTTAVQMLTVSMAFNTDEARAGNGPIQFCAKGRNALPVGDDRAIHYAIVCPLDWDALRTITR
jgi:hypothetical protein